MELMERTHRLFFALWPTEALRDELVKTVEPLLEGKKARRIRPDNFHITLAFLGAVQARKLPSIMEAASGLDGEPLELRLEKIEAWPGSHVLCLTPGQCAPLSDLVERLRRNLLAHQVELDQKDFRPHVTVAREWRDRSIEGAIEPIEWSANEFVLVESENTREGSRYQIIGRWPLAARSQY
jgi:RNA 2',3'-cyclic 3'-phosphodiesterase